MSSEIPISDQSPFSAVAGELLRNIDAALPKLRSISDWDEWIAQYAQSHTNPVNRACHTIGIPLIALSLGLFAAWLATGRFRTEALALFAGGWLLQFVGHWFEGETAGVLQGLALPPGGPALVGCQDGRPRVTSMTGSWGPAFPKRLNGGDPRLRASSLVGPPKPWRRRLRPAAVRRAIVYCVCRAAALSRTRRRRRLRRYTNPPAAMKKMST